MTDDVDADGLDRSMVVIHTLEEIPVFASEAKEAAFWFTHEFSDEL